MLTLALLPRWEAYANSEVNAPAAQRYFIRATVFPWNRTVKGASTILFRNTWGVAQEKIYFHLYPNAPDFRRAGGMGEIVEVFYDGVNSTYTEGLVDGTVVEISLPTPLGPGEEANITILFELRLPVKQDRYGMYGDVIALGNWYPIIAAYDGDGWHLEPYYTDGESFYFEAALYDVTIKIPSSFIVAATGVRESAQIEGGWRVERWVATLPVREFACMASPRYKVSSAEARIGARRVKVYSYYFPEHQTWGEVALEAAVRSLELFSRLYGEYPYPEYRVCESYGWFGGMEYPMLVMISSRLYAPNRRDVMEMVVAHETAHQWWYGLIGNNEGGEPFMDEAFAEYSGIVYFEFTYGRGEFERQFLRFVRRPFYSYIARRGVDYPLTSSVWDFPDSYAYYANIYEKGALVLHYLRWILGDDRFFEGLREVYRRYRFGIVHIEDFITVMETVAGRDLGWFYNFWILSSGIPELDVRATAGRVGGYYTVYLRVRDRGSVQAAYPVPARIVCEGFSFDVVLWVENGRGEETFNTPTRPLGVVLDPNDVVPGKDPGEVEIEFAAGYEFEAELVKVLIVGLLFAMLCGSEARKHRGSWA